MTSEGNQLDAEIRNWLKYHPVTGEEGLDVHGIPPMLFDLMGTDERLKQLNRQIKSLPLQQQKLLLYLSRNIDPALIIESMEYKSPELFWLDKALLVKEVDPTARQQDVLQVFAVNESLLEEIISVSDQIDREKEKSKSRKYRNWSLIAVPFILLLLYLFVYPLLVKPEPMTLYEKFKDQYHPDLALVDTTTQVGSAYYEAILLLDEGNLTEAADLFRQVIPEDSACRVGSRWFLSLISLHEGDLESCREQLKAIRNEDPSFYKRIAEKLLRKL